MASHSSLTVKTTSDGVVIDILTTIAKAENAAVTELTPPLSDVIEPDALERVLRDGSESTRVTFRYRQWAVNARGDGTVELTELSDGK